jgi:hypothetical protein
MSMFTFTPAWMAIWKDIFKGEVDKAEFYAESQWNLGEIVSKQVLPNGLMRVLIRIENPTVSEILISKIRILDANDAEIGRQDVNITLDSDAYEILYSLDFDIFQVTVNADDTGEYDKVE